MSMAFAPLGTRNSHKISPNSEAALFDLDVLINALSFF